MAVARLARRLPGVTLAVSLSSGAARADDPTEFWSELNLYENVGPTTRL